MPIKGRVEAGEIGPAIRQARKAAGLRQEDVAMATGFSVKYLSDLERGKTSTPLDMVARVVQALGGTLRVEFRKNDDDA